MPYKKKVKIIRKKREYKKKTPKKQKITAKNKNIIKVNVSNSSGGGGGGTTTIPIPYPTSIGSGMFPTTQPVNIYNTMSRNPFEMEYKTESEKMKEQDPLKIETPIQPEPQLLDILDMPTQSSIYSSMFPINEPANIYNTMSRNPFQTKSIETQTEPIKMSSSTQTKPIPMSISTQTEPEISIVRPKIESQPELQPELQPNFQPITPSKFNQIPQFGIGLIEELKKKQEERALKKMPRIEDWFQDNPEPRKKVGKPVSNEDEILSPIRKYENNPNVSLNEQEIRNQLKNQGKTNAQIGQLIYHMKRRGEL